MDKKSYQDTDKESFIRIFMELSRNVPFQPSMREKLLYKALHERPKSMVIAHTTNFFNCMSIDEDNTAKDRSCKNVKNRITLEDSGRDRRKMLSHDEIKTKLMSGLMKYKEEHN